MSELSTSVLSVSQILGTLSNQLGRDHTTEVLVSIINIARALNALASTIDPGPAWSSYPAEIFAEDGTLQSAIVTGAYSQFGKVVMLRIGFELIDLGTVTTGNLGFSLPVAANSGTLQVMTGFNADIAGVAQIRVDEDDVCILQSSNSSSIVATTTFPGGAITGVYEAA